MVWVPVPPAGGRSAWTCRGPGARRTPPAPPPVPARRPSRLLGPMRIPATVPEATPNEADVLKRTAQRTRCRAEGKAPRGRDRPIPWRTMPWQAARAPVSGAPWSRRSSAVSPGPGEGGGLHGGLRFVVTSRVRDVSQERAEALTTSLPRPRGPGPLGGSGRIRRGGRKPSPAGQQGWARAYPGLPRQVWPHCPAPPSTGVVGAQPTAAPAAGYVWAAGCGRGR
jgi:hypothetical protein